MRLWRSWGSDGTWYGWLLALGAGAAILWVSLGVLRGDADDGWERRGAPALAWTGEQLFVYGGNPVPREGESVQTLEPLGDAALIDPESGDVDVLADPPFDRPLRNGPAALASDDEVLLIGQLCRETDDPDRACAAGAYRGAVYSVEDDEWQELELPGRLQRISNGQSEAVGVTSDGRAVVLLGARGTFGALASRELWAYSFGDGEWEALPPPGTLIEGVCLADDAVVVGSGLLPQTAGDTGPTLRVLDLGGDARSWFPSPPAGVVPTGDAASITCGDDLVLFDDGEEALALFTLGGGWDEVAAQPGDDAHTSRLWTGEEFLFLDPTSATLAYDPEGDAWRGIGGSASTGGRAVWTGRFVVGWPGRTDLPVEFRLDG